MKRTACQIVMLPLLCLTLAAQRHAQAEPKTVYLDQARSWLLFSNARGGARPLAREIVRQAFLQAARDELGLTTRDAWLGDPMPTQGEIAPWDIVVVLSKPMTVSMMRGFPPSQTEFLSHALGEPILKNNQIDYQRLTEMEETLSRTEFVQGLKRAGFQGERNSQDQAAEVPEPIEALLGEMNFLSQFHALRELHQIIRDEGESPALLGALSRGYANLGVMTEFYWHPAHRVFKARSLLYAQRMVAQDEKSPIAKWHRAYSAALAGIPNWAQSDLKEADQAWQAIDKNNRPPKPPWVQLIAPLCRYDIDSLDQHVKDSTVGQLAALLKFLAVEQAGGDVWAVRTAIQTVEVIPECYRVHDSLCEFAGVATLHSATIEPIQLLGQHLYGRVEAMSGLSDAVRTVAKKQTASSDHAFPGSPEDPRSDFVREFKVRKELIEALFKTGEACADNSELVGQAKLRCDLGEPSWLTLGLLIRELSFMQVYRRARFERYNLDVPTEPWLAIAAPLAENHPYRAFLETHAWDAAKAKEAEARLAKVQPAGIEKNAYRLKEALGKNDRAREEFGNEIYRNADVTVWDLVTLLRYYERTPKNALRFAKLLLLLSPDSPYARAVLVRHDWERVQGSAEQWDTTSASYPHLSYILGWRYMQLGRWDDAERCLRAAIKVAPGNPQYYRQLARLYKLRGQTDQWLTTLEKYLDQPDYGLAHSQVKSEIAYHFMAQKQWEKALPYAEGAAECYSGWGLLCAAECYEGLQRWLEAEKHYRACSERYRGRSLNWYFFCHRTGQGDLEASQRLAREYIKDRAKMSEEPAFHDLATFYLLEQQPEMAAQTLEQALAKKPTSYEALWLAVVADQLRDVKNRERALNSAKSLCTGTGNEATSRPNWVNSLADLILKDLAQGGKGQIDLAVGDKIDVSLDGRDRVRFQYLLAQYLSLHGQREAADRYGKACMACTEMEIMWRTLAGAMLLKDNIKPADYKAFLQPKSTKDDRPKPQTQPPQESKLKTTSP